MQDVYDVHVSLRNAGLTVVMSSLAELSSDFSLNVLISLSHFDVRSETHQEAANIVASLSIMSRRRLPAHIPTPSCITTEIASNAWRSPVAQTTAHTHVCMLW